MAGVYWWIEVCTPSSGVNWWIEVCTPLLMTAGLGSQMDLVPGLPRNQLRFYFEIVHEISRRHITAPRHSAILRQPTRWTARFGYQPWPTFEGCCSWSKGRCCPEDGGGQRLCRAWLQMQVQVHAGPLHAVPDIQVSYGSSARLPIRFKELGMETCLLYASGSLF